VDPDFLADQTDRSRANLGVDTIDVFYLHNPETQLGFLSREEFDAALRRAFGRLEQLVAEHKIRWYGAATWDGFRKKGALSLPRMVALALEECGPEHHFRFIQLPFNLGMVEAFLANPENANSASLNPENAKPESVLEAASRLGIAAIASATLSQTQALEHMPKSVAELLPGLTNAQRAIQFTRSTPGVATALVGMGRREHVLENLGVAHVAPVTHGQYLRLYQ
jgi:aryl-alcohol dehydrogenase-like predicted oxidoreductase